jgi:hypothetical protein
MRSTTRWIRGLVGSLVLLAGAAAVLGAVTYGSRDQFTPVSAGAADRATSTTSSSSSTTSTSTTAPPVVLIPPAGAYAPGNPQLDTLLPTFPAVLFAGGATVHYGWNPLDSCCHAGGYNPDPNDVWVGPSAFDSPARLTYVAVHELAHSLHLKTDRAAALTAAVAGAPVVRAGEWDVSEKVSDCVAWALYPAETAASGITYWSCPEPYRSQVREALTNEP